MRSIVLSLLLIACQSDNTTKTFNDNPVVVITSHSASIEVVEGDTVTFRAQASDSNDGFDELSVAWYLGEEMVCEWATPMAGGDSSCAITFGGDDTAVVVEARDPEGAGGRAEISVVIIPNEPPTVSLLEPIGGDGYYSDQMIRFSASVSDAEDAPEDILVTWTSSIDGELLINSNPDADGQLEAAGYLSEGQHFIEITVTDTMGKSVSDNVVIQVGGANHVPDCAITAPADETGVSLGQNIIFRGTATDEDITVDHLDIMWRSDKDGDLGSGSINSNGEITFPFGDLSADIHTITLSVTDEIGTNCSDSIIVSVGTAPQVTLSAPQVGALYRVGESISFQASVTDADEISSNIQLEWASDLDGVFSTQASDSNGAVSFTKSTLSRGNHSISVTATDSSGLTTIATTNVLINAVPTIPTLSLSPSSPDTQDNIMVLATGSTDADNHPITYQYQWLQNGVLTSHSSSLLQASNTTKGDVWVARVVANDGYHNSPQAEVSVTILNSPPVISTVSISPTNPTSSDTLTCAVTASDADAETLTSAFIWTNQSTGVVLGSGASLSITPNVVSPNDVLRCDVTVADSDDSVTSSELVTILNSAPTVATPLITGNAYIGQNISCSALTADADGDSLSIVTTWSVQGQVISNQSTLALSNSIVDPTDTLTCTVQATDPSGASASAVGTVVVGNQVPTIDSISLSPTAINHQGTIVCSATASDLDGEIPTISYTWRNITTGSVLGTSSSLTLSPATATGQDEIRCTAQASDGYGGTSSDTASFFVENSAPVFTVGASISPNTSVKSNTTLTCSGTAVDSDGSTPLLSYTWSNQTQNTVLGTQSTLTLNNAIVATNNSVRCTITATDADGETATSTANVTVTNSVPVISSVTVSPSVAYTNDTLTASVVATDVDAHTLTYTYQWSVNGNVVQVNSTPTLAPSFFAHNDLVSVMVLVQDGFAASAPQTQSITISNALLSAPTITLTPAIPMEGVDDLVCSVTGASTDIDGDTPSYDFAWNIVGSGAYVGSIDTATTSTVPYSATTGGEEWMCTVTPNDGFDDGASSSASVVIDVDWDGLKEFDSCGKTGQTGPSQTQCDNAYVGSTLDGEVTVTSGIQYWTVPTTGTYRITAVGAVGGDGGGYGASMRGDFALVAGDVLKILVGQSGANGSGGGGGGGSFVTTNGNAPLVIAGGGGGRSTRSKSDGTTNGCGQTGDGSNPGTGGCNGNGGNGAVSTGNSGGGGLLTSGTQGTYTSTPGIAFVNGGTGGNGAQNNSAGWGGFGGGGGGNDGGHSGGGGGYSGGGGSGNGGSGSGGGGGSYNGGTNQANSSGVNNGMGYVWIDKL